MGERKILSKKKLKFNSIGPSAKISKYHHNGIQISFSSSRHYYHYSYKSAVCLLFFVCFIVFLKTTIFSFLSFFCSIFLNYYVDLFCHCPISSPFCYLLKITHLIGCSPLGVHSIGHWAHSWVRSIEVECTRSALVKCKCAWYAKKIFYYDKEARGTQRKNVNLCGGWCGGCDENFKYFYPSACGGVNQPIEKKFIKL